MIARLKGKVVDVAGQQLVIDVCGVGYEVSASANVLGARSQTGTDIELIIFTDVKENSISLFGFRDNLEKQVFLLLRRVKGVGSKLAMSILSSLGAEQLLMTIGREDISGLTKVPGIGKKTAERLIVELRESVGELVSTGEETFATVVQKVRLSEEMPQPGGIETDAAMALEKLGFPAERARRAVAAAVDAAGGLNSTRIDASELLRRALAQL